MPLAPSTARRSRSTVWGNFWNVKLPKFLKPLFWEYEFSKLGWPKDRETVILKILEHGDRNAILWLRQTEGDEGLREWITVREGRGLSPRTLRFWEVLLDLPHRKVTAWVKREQAGPWEQRLNPR